MQRLDILTLLISCSYEAPSDTGMFMNSTVTLRSEHHSMSVCIPAIARSSLARAPVGGEEPIPLAWRFRALCSQRPRSKEAMSVIKPILLTGADLQHVTCTGPRVSSYLSLSFAGCLKMPGMFGTTPTPASPIGTPKTSRMSFAQYL